MIDRTEAIPDVELFEIEAELGKRSLRRFMRMAWPYVEPHTKFIPNWHVDAVAEHLEACSKGQLERLVINIPPGTMKSLTVAVMWHAWEWASRPWSRYLTASYSGRLARRDALKARRIMEHVWYRRRWGTWQPNPEDWSNVRYSNSAGGFRLATTPQGMGVGEHVNFQVIDDPVKPLEARTDKVDTAALEQVLTWWDETMASRILRDQIWSRVVMMQRLHVRDLSGHMVKRNYEHLMLPMEFDPKRKCVTYIKLKDGTKKRLFEDPRTESKELLWPKRFDRHIVAERRTEFGPKAAAAQEDQLPQPAGGGLFKTSYVKYWRVFPVGTGCQHILSLDCSFKDLQSSSYVVCQYWIRKGGEYFLIDQMRGHMALSATCKALITMAIRWPKATAKLVEDKANGTAVIELLKDKISGIIPVNPIGGKAARANAVEPLWAAGNVYIPDPEVVPRAAQWIPEFLHEYEFFPGAENDDQVDAMTQALSYLHGNSYDAYQRAMQSLGASR